MTFFFSWDKLDIGWFGLLVLVQWQVDNNSFKKFIRHRTGIYISATSFFLNQNVTSFTIEVYISSKDTYKD